GSRAVSASRVANRLPPASGCALPGRDDRERGAVAPLLAPLFGITRLVDPGKLLLFTVGGLSTAAYLFIVSAGLSLVFGALRVINMAHGSLYMIAAFVTVVVAAQIGAVGGFWTGLLVAVIVTGLIGALIEIVVLRRVYREQHLIQLLGTYALTLIIAGAVRLVFGASYRTVKAPDFLSGNFAIAGASYSTYQLFMIGAALVIAAGVYL